MTQLEIKVRDAALEKVAGFRPTGPVRAEMEDTFAEYIDNFTEGALWMLKELNRMEVLHFSNSRP